MGLVVHPRHTQDSTVSPVRDHLALGHTRPQGHQVRSNERKRAPLLLVGQSSPPGAKSHKGDDPQTTQPPPEASGAPILTASLFKQLIYIHNCLPLWRLNIQINITV